ncbi:hypothetical protein VSDG_09242 [Cytospora chrysosperma]|uniref:Uncharacterized protein n=1 Tax=Cytospora chrysosperma TaxID=252740 RepID=A0A423VC26_CYTCH|nr:hypothetical protein VSDG_09242 [Valsa sordida]
MDANSEPGRATPSATALSFLSRTLTRRTQDPEDESYNSKGPLGLTTVHDPGPHRAAVADIIFVHGLNGGSQSTWSKGNIASNFWPKAWLPMDDAFRQDVRVHSFGYPSGLSRESILNIRDFAKSLLAAVKDSPVIGRDGETGIIFIAHSMGGLVVKMAYILGHSYPEFQTVIDRVFSIVFLGTPHQGAAIARTLSRLVALVGARPFVEDLLPESPMLQAINEEFPRVAGKLQLISFYETRPMSVGGIKLLIVEKNSAVMNLANERTTLLDADHRHVAMFSSPTSPAYLTVRNALATLVSSRRDETHCLKQLVAQEDRHELNRFLAIANAPDDDIMVHDSVRLPGSCEWLARKDYYLRWKNSSKSNFLWIRGRPGAGKSVLAGHVVNDLRDCGLDCCFFFFKSSDNAKSNPNAFLRCMAWQMAMLHPGIMTEIKELVPEGTDAVIDQLEHHVVWRKLYLSRILKAQLDRPQFWVIDSIDESKASLDVMNFLVRIQESWPVSILVTSRDPVELHLSKANIRTTIHSEVIMDEDVKEDIALLLKSSLDLLPCPASNRWPTPETMASHIIDNSKGCFLWASLVCSELLKVTTGKEIEEVLTSIPSDMDALYTKILQDVSDARFGKDLAKAFITWTTYAFRPLSTSELQEPIELDINDKIDDVERTVAKCCRNIIYVDTHSKVQLVHATAREFFMTRPSGSDFTATKTEGHRRLAKVCLQFLMQSDRGSSRPSRLAPDRGSRTLRSSLDSNVLYPNTVFRSEPKTRNAQRPSVTQPASFEKHPFMKYATKYVFPHLNFIHSDDQEILALVVNFLGGSSVLRWIEFVAAHGDLHTVYKAGKIINALLVRRSRQFPPLGLAYGQNMFQMLEKWGDDLIHIVTKFSRQLQSSPSSIHHLIPPFCPKGSAIRQQFATIYRGLDVQGLARNSWDDCLTTISYDRSMKPNAVATGPGFFAVGMMIPDGKIMIYGDSIFQEVHTLMHKEPVWRLEFSKSGRELASSGVKMVRIWSTTSGNEIASFRVPSPCLALQFSDEDTILRVVTRQNHLIEWDMIEQKALRGQYDDWTADLEENMQFRSPTTVALGSATGLMCVIYRGEDILLWDYMEDRLYDTFEKETGSVSAFGSHKIAPGSTTVGWVTFSHAIDTNLLAAAYIDGDMVVYDIVTGEAIASVNNGNIVLVSSSPDGRILAGADSHGNLTLFEFETLKPLYRIQFDTQMVPKSLAFTSDSRRIVELRGNYCRIWEPSVLFHTDVMEVENGDTASVSISVSTALQEFKHENTREVDITAIACCKSSNVVFYALHDGSVFASDISGEPESQLIFTVTSSIPVHMLEIDESSSILATADRGGRITARKVVQCPVPGGLISWHVDKPLIDMNNPGSRPIQHIMISGHQSRLLVSTCEYDALFPMPGNGKGSSIAEVARDGVSSWVQHPTKPECLLLVSESKFGIYNWTNLHLIESIQSPSSGVDGLIPLEHPQFFATYSIGTVLAVSTDLPKNRIHKDDRAIKMIQIWDARELENPRAIMKPISQLDDTFCSSIASVIGAYGDRLVFCTIDHWIASIDLQAPQSPGLPADTLVCHFFIPNDWITVDYRDLNFGLGRAGEVLFPKGSELAVIRRGLETTESGGSFNPRGRGASKRGPLPLRLRSE